MCWHPRWRLADCELEQSTHISWFFQPNHYLRPVPWQPPQTPGTRRVSSRDNPVSCNNEKHQKTKWFFVLLVYHELPTKNKQKWPRNKNKERVSRLNKTVQQRLFNPATTLFWLNPDIFIPIPSCQNCTSPSSVTSVTCYFLFFIPQPAVNFTTLPHPACQNEHDLANDEVLLSRSRVVRIEVLWVTWFSVFHPASRYQF